MRSIITPITLALFLAAPAWADKKATMYSCDKIRDNVKKYLEDKVNDLFENLKFKYSKELVGQKGWVRIAPPKVKIEVTRIDKKANRIYFKPSLTKGTVSAGVKLDLVFKTQERKGEVSFPKKDMTFAESFYFCPVNSCGMLDNGKGRWAEVATLVFNAFLNQVREANKTIKIKGVTLKVDWPNVTLKQKGDDVTATVTSWRVRSIAYQSYEFSIPKKWEIPALSVTFRCPFAPKKEEEKRKKPPAQDDDGASDDKGAPGDRVNLYVEFEFNSTKMTPTAKNTLSSTAAKKSFAEPPKVATVHVIGHADCIPGKDGTQSVNQWFSEERAKEVAGFLRGKYRGWTFQSEGKSSKVPHCTVGQDEDCEKCSCKGKDKDTEGCRKDRRVEIRFAD